MRKEVVQMKKAKLTAVVCICALALTACGDSKETSTQSVTTVPETTASVQQEMDESPAETETEAAEAETENTEETATYDELQKIIDETKPLDINITESSTPDEIMQAGKAAAFYFEENTDRFFEYGVDLNWKIDYEDQAEVPFYKILGIYIDKRNGVYVPLSGEETKQFLLDRIGLTERGYEELSANSPSKYKFIGDDIYVASGDGGQAGLVGSYIADYEINGDGTITYNCIVKSEESSGFDDTPFTFRIANENGIWKLDGCSLCEGLCHAFIGLESDVENYLNRPEIPYDEIQEILEKRYFINTVTLYDTLSFDTEDKVTVDGLDYYRVTDEDFDDWDEWTAYVKSVYTDNKAEQVISENQWKIISVDGKTYTNNGGKGSDLLDRISWYESFRYDDSSTISVNTETTDGHFVTSNIRIKETPDGWRIEEELSTL